MTYFWEGPYAEETPWGAPPLPLGLIVPDELVFDHSAPEDIQTDE